MVSAAIPVSSASTFAALAVGATPSTGRPWRLRSSAARRSAMVLPAPAGPTTSTTAVLAGDSRSGVRLEDVEPFAVDRGRRCRRHTMGVCGEGEDALLLGEDALAREVRLGRCDPRRPAVEGAGRTAALLGVERRAGTGNPVDGPLDCRRPPAARRRRQHGREIPDLPQHVGAAPGRAGGGEGVEHRRDRRLVRCRRLPADRPELFEQAVTGPAKRAGFVAPTVGELGDRGAGLGPS